MATRLRAGTLNINSYTTAGIRDCVGEIEALLTAGGWVQTADTGQTAAASFPAATAINQVLGNQIWRMADSDQSSAPIFMKLEFGSGGSASSFTMWVTIGSGSDGAGTITQGANTLLARTALNAIGASMGTFVGSASNGRINWYLGYGIHHLFSIERVKDSSGVDTANGVMIYIDGSATSATAALLGYKIVRSTGNTPLASTNIGAIAPSGATWALGTNVGMSPFRFFDGQPSNPGLNTMLYLNGDIAASSSISLNVYGSAHTYYTLGTTLIANLVNSNSNTTLAILYE